MAGKRLEFLARQKLQALGVGLLMASSGCEMLSGGSEAQCSQSIATLRQALTFHDFDSARKWRDYCWKVCGKGPQVEALDAEIIAAEKAAAEAEKAKEKKQRELAQARINAAQKSWREYDMLPAKQRTRETLSRAERTARLQSKGLPPEFEKQVDSYNDAEHKKRVASLAR